AFESTLKSWEDKQKCEFPRTPPPQPPQPPLSSQPEIVSEEEASLVSEFGQAAGALIRSIREVAQSHHSLEQELAHAVNASSKAMDVVYANSKSSGALSCSVVVQMVSNVKALLTVDLRQEQRMQPELRLSSSRPLIFPGCPVIDPGLPEDTAGLLLRCLKAKLGPKVQEPVTDLSSDRLPSLSRSLSFVSVLKFKRQNNKNKETCTLSLPVHQWGTEEVGAWLDFLCLTEYKDIFIGHDVRGAELIHLERRDLKDLGAHCLPLLLPLCCYPPPHPPDLTSDPRTRNQTH
ncbi:diacylglycerol kinase delta isoform X1, partial [Lates japonicus]